MKSERGLCIAEVRLPGDVSRIEGTEPNRVLVVGHVRICLKAQDLCVADIRAVNERAEEQQREDRQDPVLS